MSTYYISLHSINYVVQVLIWKWNPFSVFSGSYHQEIKCISYHRRGIHVDLKETMLWIISVMLKRKALDLLKTFCKVLQRTTEFRQCREAGREPSVAIFLHLQHLWCYTSFQDFASGKFSPTDIESWYEKTPLPTVTGGCWESGEETDIKEANQQLSQLLI